MNYIVMDLEWNQSAYGRAGEHPRMPFEIIEIGAVKVNEKMEIVGEFQTLIRPKVYTKLHRNIREMLNYGEEELKNGIPFKEAAKEFLSWCGTNYMFCTWGMSDVFYLQNNMDFYHMEKLPYPVKFYNVQQIYADKYDKEHNICKLEKAVDQMRIMDVEPFHTAINDARYTARVMKAARFGDFSEKYTVDLYRHPRKKEEQLEFVHDGVIEFISGEYPSKQKAMEDEDVTAMRCPKCGRKLSKKIKWFSNAQNSDIAIGRCFYHGYIQGKIKFKASGTSDDYVFAIKRISRTDRKGLEAARQRQQELREKKRQKRSTKKNTV